MGNILSQQQANTLLITPRGRPSKRKTKEGEPESPSSKKRQTRKGRGKGRSAHQDEVTDDDEEVPDFDNDSVEKVGVHPSSAVAML